MGLSFPAQTGSCSRLWESRNVTICVLLHLKIKKILNASHLLILHPNFIPVSGGRGGRWFLSGEALFKEKELPIPGVLLDPETIRGACAGWLGVSVQPLSVVPKQSGLERMNPSPILPSEAATLGLWIIKRRFGHFCEVDAQ